MAGIPFQVFSDRGTALLQYNMNTFIASRPVGKSSPPQSVGEFEKIRRFRYVIKMQTLGEEYG